MEEIPPLVRTRTVRIHAGILPFGTFIISKLTRRRGMMFMGGMPLEEDGSSYLSLIIMKGWQTSRLLQTA